MMSCKKIVILLGAVLASFFLLKSDARPLADTNKNSIVEDNKFWTADELATMAKSKTMEDAVSFLTSATVREAGAPSLHLDEIKAVIDGKTTADLRAALMMATGVQDKRKTKDDKQIIEFAGAVNAAATCAAEHTAGGLGVDTCIDVCEEKSTYLKWSSRKGACYMLCTIAASPCTAKGPFWWRATETAKSWGSSATEWFALASLRTQTVVVVLVWATVKALISVVSDKWGARVHKTEGKQWRCTQDADKAKGEYLVQTHDRLLKKRALHNLHDFAARATHKASQEAAAAKAAKAKAIALQAAIDQVVAEQGTSDEGGSAGVLS